MDHDILTAERLRSLLSYDPKTGIFTWKVPRQGREIGKPAGALVAKLGYIRICVDYRHYYAHRLAWFYHYGTWPEAGLDHINRIKTDNRIANLREITHVGNGQNRIRPQRNNRSGFLGVMWSSQKGKWQAVIVINRKRRHLGFFDDPATAHKAYLDAKLQSHPAYRECV